MKAIDTYIIEKLHINKNILKHNHSELCNDILRLTSNTKDNDIANEVENWISDNSVKLIEAHLLFTTEMHKYLKKLSPDDANKLEKNQFGAFLEILYTYFPKSMNWEKYKKIQKESVEIYGTNKALYFGSAQYSIIIINKETI